MTMRAMATCVLLVSTVLAVPLLPMKTLAPQERLTPHLVAAILASVFLVPVACPVVRMT